MKTYIRPASEVESLMIESKIMDMSLAIINYGDGTNKNIIIGPGQENEILAPPFKPYNSHLWDTNE